MSGVVQGNHDRFLRQEFRTLFEKERTDTAVFAVLTVVLTPVFVAAAVLALVFALALVDLPIIDQHGFDWSFLTGVNLTLGFMVASYFLRPKPEWQRKKSDDGYVAAALGLFCLLLGFSYFTQLVKTHPMLFWPMYLLVFFSIMACIGAAYVAHDDYYLSWISPVIIDDPFTFRDDIDRAHFSLGFLAAISGFVFESYATIFRDRWLWRPLDAAQISVAVRVLSALAVNDPETAPPPSLASPYAAHVIRALVKLEMVTMERGKMSISLKGREFLSSCF